MTNLPKIRTRYGEGVGVEIFVQFPDISANEKSYFDADEAAGQTGLSANGTNFAVDQYVVLGQPGVEKTEIVKLHAATAPTSSTITTAAATTYAHSRGDKIQFIPFNKITVERSTDSGVNFTPLTAVDIRPDASETYIQRTGDASTDVYRVRFYNSTSTLYSAYSDSATASGYADNTVWSVKRRALEGMGEEIGGKITDSFLNHALDELRREVDQDDRVLRWSFRTKFNTDVGTIVPGRWSLAVPTDLRDKNTNKNILSLRIGRNNRSLDYQDVNRFNQNYLNIAHSTLNGAITTASTSIVLTSSGDFDEDGSIDIAAEDLSEEIDNVTYTANNETTNTLSGVLAVTANHATARDVWQNATFGEPGAYTINDGYIYFDLPFENELAGENIYSDYYQELQAVDSDGDVLDEPVYDQYVYGLRWKIKYLLSNGKLDVQKDPDFIEWKKGVNRLVNQEIVGQEINFIPE